MEFQGISIGRTILKKKNKLGVLTLPNFKRYYKAAVIKTWYCYKDRHVDQWNRIESTKTMPYIYKQLIFNSGAKTIICRENRLFNKWCWENWISTCKRMKLELYLIPLTNSDLKWIKDLNVRPETIKLLGENREKAP